MPVSLPQRIRSERGFTLIELLVVMLIIGTLAAIALPALLGQRQKAQDTEAKTQLRTMRTALESFYSENQSYSGATFAKLQDIEPSLKDGKATSQAVTGSTDTYTISSKAIGTLTTFTLVKGSTGTITRTCDNTDKGGCNSSGSW